MKKYNPFSITRRDMLGAALGGFPLAALGSAAMASDRESVLTSAAGGGNFRLAMFAADVTCPVGHPLLGGLRQPAKKIVDPLSARGLVILGAAEPIVVCAIDWCEIRNRSYDRWRQALADAAGTKRERVLFCSIHQHDAPLTDDVAADILSEVGLAGVMFDRRFEQQSIERTANALRESLKQSRRITHIGTGQARVERIASSRRVVGKDGSVNYGRGSSSGGNTFLREAPVGLIDPWLKTLSFWDADKPLAALHAYSTHPMSYYGQGGVSADFVGMARKLIGRDNPSVFQIYASGCSGDVTAGKYNDGSAANRPVLAQRLYTAMKQAWKATTRQPLKSVTLRTTQLDLEFRRSATHTVEALKKVVRDKQAGVRNRILAAMGLASRRRVNSGQKIDFSSIDFGPAQVVLFPGESFVAYQLLAQKQRPDSFVVSLGYGECWPGYIPSPQGFKDNFNNSWNWVAPGSDERVKSALAQILPAPGDTKVDCPFIRSRR